MLILFRLFVVAVAAIFIVCGTLVGDGRTTPLLQTLPYSSSFHGPSQPEKEVTRSPRVAVVSYASQNLGPSMVLLRQGLEKLRKRGLIHDIYTFTDKDIPSILPQTCLQYHPSTSRNPKASARYRRGNGYWLWKPFTIAKVLSGLQPNDILIYVDAGSIIQDTPGALNDFRNHLQQARASKYGILPTRFPDTKYQVAPWTKPNVLQYFGVTPTSEIATRGQIVTGLIWIRKTKDSSQIIQAWCDIAETKPSFFFDLTEDEKKQASPHVGFQEHRHDQAIFSLLCDTFPSDSSQLASLNAMDFEFDGPKASYVVFERTYKASPWRTAIQRLHQRFSKQQWATIHQRLRSSAIFSLRDLE